MRALHLFALAAGLVVSAAAAHAQLGVYVGPAVSYAAPAYGFAYSAGSGNGYWAPAHWTYGPAGRYWLAQQWVARAGWYGDRPRREDWRERSDWDRGRDWDRDRDRGWNRGADRNHDRWSREDQDRRR